jgi:endoglucanase
MRQFILVTFLLALLALIQRTTCLSKPSLPLSSQSRWIVDPSGHRVKLRCSNWAGHMEANIPEGLHRRSIGYIANWILDQGFNCVRLTYSINMALNPSLKVRQSFVTAARAASVSEEAMLDLYNSAVSHNPFLATASVLEVFGQVVDELWDRGLMTILDNHVSRASWCCDLEDGNGWWSDAPIYLSANSRYFDSEKWLAGLRAMALWSQSRPSIVGLSLRNEPRATWTQILFAANTWNEKMAAAAQAIHDVNPNVLVVIAGLNGGTDLSHLRIRALNTSNWRNKLVWETHDYSFTITTPNFKDCNLAKANYGLLAGFVLEQGASWTGPLWVSEFGVGMQGGPNAGLSDEDYEYLTCLVSYLEGNDADWALWALQGSYYVRDGVVDNEETWGALDYEWRAWRNTVFKTLLGNLFNVTQGP